MGGNRLVCPYTQLLEMSRRLGKYDEADMYVKEDTRAKTTKLEVDEM